MMEKLSRFLRSLGEEDLSQISRLRPSRQRTVYTSVYLMNVLTLHREPFEAQQHHRGDYPSVKIYLDPDRARALIERLRGHSPARQHARCPPFRDHRQPHSIHCLARYTDHDLLLTSLNLKRFPRVLSVQRAHLTTLFGQSIFCPRESHVHTSQFSQAKLGRSKCNSAQKQKPPSSTLDLYGISLLKLSMADAEALYHCSLDNPGIILNQA